MEATLHLYVALSLLWSVKCFPWIEPLQKTRLPGQQAWSTQGFLEAAALPVSAGFGGNAASSKDVFERPPSSAAHARKGIDSPVFSNSRGRAAEAVKWTKKYVFAQPREEETEALLDENADEGGRIWYNARYSRRGYTVGAAASRRPHKLQRNRQKTSATETTSGAAAFLSTRTPRGSTVDFNTSATGDDTGNVAPTLRAHRALGAFISKNAKTEGGKYGMETDRKKGLPGKRLGTNDADIFFREGPQTGDDIAEFSSSIVDGWTGQSHYNGLGRAAVGFRSNMDNSFIAKKEQDIGRGLQRNGSSGVLPPEAPYPVSPLANAVYAERATDPGSLPSEKQSIFARSGGEILLRAEQKNTPVRETQWASSEKEATANAERLASMLMGDALQNAVLPAAKTTPAIQVATAQTAAEHAHGAAEAPQPSQMTATYKTPAAAANGGQAAAEATTPTQGPPLPQHTNTTAAGPVAAAVPGIQNGGGPPGSETTAPIPPEEPTYRGSESPICGAWQTVQESAYVVPETPAMRGVLGSFSTNGGDATAAGNGAALKREGMTGNIMGELSAGRVAGLANPSVFHFSTCQWLPRHGLHIVERRTYTENPNTVDVERLEFAWAAGCLPDHLTRRWIYSGTWESTRTAVDNKKGGAFAEYSVKITWTKVQVHADFNTLSHLQETKERKHLEKAGPFLKKDKEECGEHDAWLSPAKMLPLDIVDFCVKPHEQLYVAVPSREVFVAPQQVAVSHSVILPGERRIRLRQGVLSSHDEGAGEEALLEETEDWENADMDQCLAWMHRYKLGWDSFLAKQNRWARQLCTWQLLRQSCPVPPKTTEYAEDEHASGSENRARKAESAPHACGMPSLRHTLYRQGDVDFLVLPQFPFGKDADKVVLRKVSGCELYAKIRRQLEEGHSR